MGKQAFILMWDGEPLTERDAAAIGGMLIGQNYCRASEMVAVQLDHEAIAKALAVNVIASTKTDERNVSTSTDLKNEAVKNAVIFIGIKYKHLLEEKDFLNFAIELSNDLHSIRSKKNFNKYLISTDEANLLNAVEIISTTPAVIPQALAREYKFTQNVVNAIKGVYSKM